MSKHSNYTIDYTFNIFSLSWLQLGYYVTFGSGIILNFQNFYDPFYAKMFFETMISM